MASSGGSWPTWMVVQVVRPNPLFLTKGPTRRQPLTAYYQGPVPY